MRRFDNNLPLAVIQAEMRLDDGSVVQGGAERGVAFGGQHQIADADRFVAGNAFQPAAIPITASAKIDRSNFFMLQGFFKVLHVTKC